MQKKAPCMVLVKKSPIVSPVGHYWTDTWFSSIQSVTNKYHMFICLVPFSLEYLPLFSIRTALYLSWKIILSSTWMPSASRKFLDNSISYIWSSTPNSSEKVDLIVLSFCLDYLMYDRIHESLNNNVFWMTLMDWFDDSNKWVWNVNMSF